jgi:hypothetical protein
MAWIVPVIQNLHIFPAAAASIAGILGSVGIYRLVSQGAEAAIHHIVWLRKWVFGGTYLHGTWVGYFIGRAGDKRYTVEHIDQDLDGIVINGQSRTDTMQPHADWTSVSVSIEGRTGRLIFSYTMTILSRPGTLEGINSSRLERASHRSAATTISGHAQDLADQVRVKVTAVKIADDLLSWEEAFKRAQSKFP